MTEHPHDRPSSGLVTARTTALVLAGHGSQHHPGSAAPLHAHADRIRDRGGFDEVRTAFWKEDPSLSSVPTIVESDVAYVVPVLTSEGYFADEVFPRELGVGDGGEAYALDAPDGPEIRYCAPVGTHESVTDVVEASVESMVEGSIDEAGVALVGHGTERNERSALATLRHAANLRTGGRYAEVAALFLDETPYVGDLSTHVDADEVIVVPLFVADGYHTTNDIPDAISHPGIDQSAEIDGQVVHYTGAVGTAPHMADVIVERAVEAGAELLADPPDEQLSPAGETFLVWLQSMPPDWSWGELSIDVDATGYELRNRRDVGLPPDEVESVDGLPALRKHVRNDDGGRYRPLSEARSLLSGWTLTGLSRSGLLRAIRIVYPGSITLWYREQTGDLPVTDFRETAARQTGDYADLEDLDDARLVATMKAVCGDCIRRRRWSAEQDDRIEPTWSDDVIPCPEACPFFLSAARVFQNTSSESLVDPDPDVPLATFEESANRYRIRFARSLARTAHGDATATPSGGDD